MTAVKAEAIRMIEQVPDSLVQEMMATMRDFLSKKAITIDTGTKRRATTSAAFNNFLSHCKKSSLTEDYKEELAESLEQRYESIH